MDYIANVLVLICLYAMLTAWLDVLVGYAGLLSLGQAAFVGTGAYGAAIAATQLRLGFGGSLLVACTAAGLVALVVAIPLLRLRGDYFVLGTFGLSVVASSVFENWVDVTNGPFGIYGIPRIAIFGWVIATPLQFLAVTLAATAFVLWAKQRLVATPFGVALMAIREDEAVARALGKNVMARKVVALTLSGFAAGVPGALLAYHLRFIDPSLFTFELSIFLWAALFVGGCGGIAANILGPVVLVAFPEALRFVGLKGSAMPEVQQALYGTLLIALTFLRPQGLAGRYRLR